MLVLRWTLDANGRLTATYVRAQSRHRPYFLRDAVPQLTTTPHTAAARLRLAVARGALDTPGSDKLEDQPIGLERGVSPTTG